ncbi:MAG: hypothetical protein LQ344_001470 [Seirophora lacunosa]|nr:MAG: hypothetical protein LQ344_001470 [Seirophora lacunosa]
MSTLTHLLPTSPSNEPAIIIPGAPNQQISHANLQQQCLSLRHDLASRGGAIGPGTAVSISLPNSLEFAAAFLAITWQRAVAAPLNPAYKEEEVAFYLADVDAKAVIVPQGARGQSSPVAVAAEKRGVAVVECYTVDDGRVVFDWPGEGDVIGQDDGEGEAREDDVALVLHTSGTTGKPKAVPLTHKNLSVSAANIVQTYKLTPEDRTMLIMPLFHVHGLVASLLATLAAGSAAIIPPKLAPSFWKDFRDHAATWYTATPTMHRILLSFPAPEPLPTIRFIRSCSSPLSPQTMSRLEAQFNAPVLEAYAMTEASHQITSNPLPPAAHYPGSVGLPSSGDIEIRILTEKNDDNSDDEENPLPPGTEGEICIRGPSLTPGYISNPAANASSFTRGGGHFFRTGDFGKVDEKGYLTLTGRIKEFINKGGEKVSPVELDNLLATHPGVAEAVTFAVEDEMYGQDVGVAVVLKEGSGGEMSARELQKWVRGRVAPLKVPKKVSCWSDS